MFEKDTKEHSSRLHNKESFNASKLETHRTLLYRSRDLDDRGAKIKRVLNLFLYTQEDNFAEKSKPEELDTTRSDVFLLFRLYSGWIFTN